MRSNLNNLVLSENDIQNAILEFLRLKKITAWRNNNGAVYDKGAGSFRRKNKWEVIYGSPSDILGVLPDGKFLTIEVKKNSKEKPSDGQKKFIKNINNSKGIGFVAFSIACVKKHLADYL